MMLQRRLPLLVTASLAGLGLAASPALAGSDGDQPPAIEQPPAPPAPPAPTPLPLPLPTPAPTIAPAPTPTHSVESEKARSKPVAAKRTHRTVAVVTKTTSRTIGTTTFPTGGVQAGAGGTSLDPGTPAAAIGLAGGSLALLLASGGIAAVRRRGASSI
jgi:outer membrane biosynthesis protein TonB